MSDNSKSQTPREIMNKLNYYKRLMKLGRLTEKQQNKYDEYLEQYELVKTNKPLKTDEEEKEQIKAYIESNKAHARERFQRLKPEPKYKFVYGELKFRTKKDVLAYFKDYLAKNDNITPDLYPSFVEFVKHHPLGFNEKTQTLIIETNNEYKGNIKNLTILTNETGHKKHVSIGTVLNGYNMKNEINGVLRKAILPQILEFKANNPKPDKCPMCNNDLTNENMNIDHVKPFRELISDYMRFNNVNYNDLTLERIDNVKTITNPGFIDGWITYHRRYAKLRYLCNKCNNEREHKEEEEI
jgi:hypothetical protein